MLAITTHKKRENKVEKVRSREAVYDTIGLDSLVKHCGTKYDIIRGYCWRTVESAELKRYIDELYRNKARTSGRDRDVYKLCLTSIYGKCLRKGSKTMKRKVFSTGQGAQKYANSHQFLLDGIEQCGEKHYVTLNWCLDKTFNHSHIGVAILSSARAMMDDLFNECDERRIDVFYSHTDCIAIDTDKVELLKHRIGEGLGELKIEASGKAHIINCVRYSIGSTIRPRPN